MKGGYRLCELQLIVIAAAYELYDTPLASDSSYDLLCRVHEEDGPTLPGFDSSTGQWVHDLMTPELDGLVRWCIEKVQSTPHDDHCHHTYIEEYLSKQKGKP